MKTRPELKRLLLEAIEIIQEHGPDQYHKPVSEYLAKFGISRGDMNWLTPRITGWAQGARWAYPTAYEDALCTALDLDGRVN